MFKKITIFIFFALLFFLLPQVVLKFYFKNNIYNSLGKIEAKEFAIVFGAKVYSDHTLSPVAEQRILAAIELFKLGKINKIFISGTNQSNDEVIVLKQFALDKGIPDDKIIVDYFGFDTNDTCKHFSKFGYNEAVFLTQEFHLPRALYMCQRQEIKGQGVVVNQLEFIIQEKIGFFTKEYIRLVRLFRESALTWSYVLGLYDKISNQAEEINISAKNILTIIKLIPNEYKASIEYDSKGRIVSQWKNNNEEIVINGAYFNEDYLPSGFLVVNNKRIGNDMFDQDKSGLLFINGGQISIRDTNVDSISPTENFEFALQSYPFLIKNFQPAIKIDSAKKARRTAIGIDKDNNIYVIMVNLKEISLYEFMNYLLSTDVPFVNVLNLDGGPSTGIYSHWNGETNFIYDSLNPVSSVIRIIK